MQSTGKRGVMNIRVLFDKLSHKSGYRTGWGVSFLIDETVLFDTGENGEWLLHNMRAMNVDIGRISTIVISHDHWDHTGGLWEFLRQKPDMTVYGCPGFSSEFKKKVQLTGARLVESGSPRDIAPGLSLSGEMPFVYKEVPMTEQALVLHSPIGISIITGCAHPGVTCMVRNVMEHFPGRKISLVTGGFHLMRQDMDTIRRAVKEFGELGIEKAGPTHCSGDDAEKVFKEAYGDNFMSVVVGDVIVTA
jgi:7,8-dihydropterin-6-yl-methyl-4-(beta-D-ribofuranosyl)aminobenzene 5'-phosphate synthase